MKFVENARQFWRWYSTWVVGLSSGLLALWPIFPDDLKAALPSWFVSLYAVVTVVAFLGARVVKQGGGQK